jgi:hypothetical protein
VRESITVDAPAGVFGTHWLMSKSEVKNVVPNAVPIGEQLAELRKVYGRDAKVDYIFENDRLLEVVVTFSVESSEVAYQGTRKKLMQDYGPMPEPATTDGRLSSQKQIGRFAIEHAMSKVFGIPIEQILFYRTTR